MQTFIKWWRGLWMKPKTGPFPGWFIVHRMGHVSTAGWVTEVCGGRMLWIVEPAVDGDDVRHPLMAATYGIGHSSVYTIDPSSEEDALAFRRAQRAHKPRPRPVDDENDEDEDIPW